MSQTSANHPLDLRDSANGPPCPMERLADRMNDCPKPKGMKVHAARYFTGHLSFQIEAIIQSPDQIEDLINYLARVKG